MNEPTKESDPLAKWKWTENHFSDHVYRYSDDWTDGAIRALQHRIKELEAKLQQHE